LEVKAVAREEFEQKQATASSAAAELAAAVANTRDAQLNLNFTTVRAPITGRISDRRVSAGNYAAAGETVLSRVVSTDPIWFSFEGAESLYLKYMRQAEAGARGSSRTSANPVDIQLADEPTYRWKGTMSFVDNTIDTNSGTIRAHAVVRNPSGFLTPGLFGRARLLGSGRYKAMLVPDEAILTDQTRKLIYVVGADGKAHSKPVETGPLVQGLRVIKSGIAPTESVIIEGVTMVQPGAAVEARQTQLKPRAADTSPTAQPEPAPPANEATVS
jgi:RND family efflux transporter MFP subunit